MSRDLQFAAPDARIDAAAIQRRLNRHNLVQWLAGAGMAVISLVLWVLSFWLWRGLIAAGLSNVMKDGIGDYSLYGAWICTLILAIEGFRMGPPLLDLARHRESIFRDTAGRSLYPGIGYWLTQFFYCAPVTTLDSLRAFRSLHRASVETLSQAAAIFMDLAATRQWTPTSKYAGEEDALRLLDRLKMTWTEIDNGQEQVRIPAATQVSDYL